MNPISFAAGSVRRRAAFTLIELLVTMVVSLLLIVFLFQLFNATVGAWRNGEDQNDTYREARAAMQMMVRDVSQTTAPMLRSPFAAPSPSPVPTDALAPVLVLDHYSPPPDPAPQSGDEINDELYCLTNIPNNGSSSLCAVGYFCMWMPDLIPASDPQAAQKRASAPQAYALVRQFLGSGRPATPTQTAVPGLFDRFQAAASGSALSFINVYERARPPTIPSTTLSPPVATGTQLASYIWDLQFRTPANVALTTPFPVPLPSPAYTAQPPYPTTLPAYVEIRFKALSAGAARKLEGNASIARTIWNDANSDKSLGNSIYQRVILPGTRQFVARVPIYGGSATATP